jgi:site-specific DNA-methyltransferase (adenine-specific)
MTNNIIRMMIKMENIPLEWKSQPKNMGNVLHTVCSYMAMFPPSLPHHFIEKYSSPGDVVLDAFSGRGTTALEACFQDRIGIGSDRNPLAYVLTFAKVNVPSKGRIISRLDELEDNYNPDKIDIKNIEKNIKMIFSKYTLKQLIYLKENLVWKTSNVDAFITSMILGILHGRSEGYLSLSMPNTFSMSPNYVKNFIKEHKLTKPKRETFELVRRKLKRCYQQPKTKGKAYSCDARRLTRIKDESIHLLVTSPPYTRLITYGKYNWIRLWFLNEDVHNVERKLFTTQSLDKYKKFMTEVLQEFKRVIKPDGKIVLVIGDVQDSNNNMVNLAEMVWKESAQPLSFEKIEEIREDVFNDGTKVSRIWGNKRVKIATKVDRILVLQKN